MPSPNLTGRVGVHAIDGTITWAAISNVDRMMESLDHEQSVEVDELRTAKNAVVGKSFTNPVDKVTVTYAPAAPAGANTSVNARNALKLPAIGTKVTLADTADFDGEYLYEGGGKRALKSKGYARVTLVLSKYEDSAVATPIV